VERRGPGYSHIEEAKAEYAKCNECQAHVTVRGRGTIYRAPTHEEQLQIFLRFQGPHLREMALAATGSEGILWGDGGGIE